MSRPTPWSDEMVLDAIQKRAMMPDGARRRALEMVKEGLIDAENWKLTDAGNERLGPLTERPIFYTGDELE